MRYSDADRKAIFCISCLLVPLIAFSIWIGLRYNERQVDDQLRSGGVTLLAKVTDVYVKSNSRAGDQYYAVLEYNYSGKHFSNTFKIQYGYCFKNNTVLLRRLKNNDSESYMKIIGVNN